MGIAVDEELDVFDVLGISNREDSYTNLLKYIFERSELFRNGFLKLVFDDLPQNPESIEFVTRSAYKVVGSNIKAKIVPDIILKNVNDFAIVEVKVEANEGNQQTQSYYDSSDKIIKENGVTGSGLRKYKFLTLYGEEPECNEFESITWKQIGDCIPQCTTIESDLDLYMRFLKERCQSLDVLINDNDPWVKSIKHFKWTTSVSMFRALSKCFDDSYDRNKHWYEFSKSNAKRLYGAQFGKQIWKSKNTVTEIKEKNGRCFDIHFEFSWNEITKELKSQIHYELNPYKSKKDLEKLYPKLAKEEVDYIKQNIQIKKEIAHAGKDWWKQNKYHKQHKEYRYSGRIGDNLYTLFTFTQTVTDKDMVSDVLNRIKPFIVIGESLVDYLMSL